MKFRYYITNTSEGCVIGTNDVEKAREFCASDDYYVVDAEMGIFIGMDGFDYHIEEVK